MTVATTHHIAGIYDMETEAVDGNDDLSVLVDDETGQTLGGSLNLSSEESTSVVRQRPAEFKILPHQTLRRCIVRNGLKLFNCYNFCVKRGVCPVP